MQIGSLDSLHVPTLTVALSVVYVGSVLFSALLYIFKRRFRGDKLMILSQSLFAAAAFGLIAQDNGLSYEFLSLTNAAMLAAVLCIGHGLTRFGLMSRFSPWAYAIVPLGVGGWFALGPFGVSARIVLFASAFTVVGALFAADVRRSSKDEFGSLRALFYLFFIIVSVSSAGRGIRTVVWEPPRTIALDGSIGAASHLSALLIGFMNMFGYFLLSSAHAERQLGLREREIRKRNEELLETIETKDALISVIAHDLRAPVWSATRYVRSHLVDFDGDLNVKRDSIVTLAEGLDRISGLLDSLLEWAMCASGRIKLQPVPVSLGEVLGEAIADLGPTAELKGVSIEAGLSDGLVVADRRALATALRNLLSNAIKYSRQGGAIKATIGPSRQAADSATAAFGHKASLSVVIEDSGVGMTPDQVAKLFVPGRTKLTLGTSGEQGKGFGLAISKRFVEAMGGSLLVDSELGHGTRFELVFPVA